MDQMSSDNGYELDSRSKGPVGKDEALRMEEDALNKMQHKRKCKTKLHPSHVHVLPNSQATITPISQLEKDLIVFPDSEPKKGAEKDLFADIDVKTLTNEELEKLLLDDNFGRPSSLLNRNISANTGGQTFSPYTANTSMLPISKSTVPNLTHLQGPVFPFQHVHAPGQQRPFLPYVSVQTVNPQVFHQPVMTPEMAKLFDKIASTSEYLRNGRSSVMDDNSVTVKSLEPVLHSTDSPSISRSDWLDLDPLSKHRVEAEKNIGALRGPVIVESVPANDPWDAVLREETEVTISNSYSTQEKDKCTVPPQPRRASTGMAVNKTHVPETSCLHKQSEQGMNESGTALKKYDILQENWGQNLEVSAFHEEIAKLKSKFSYDDPSTNPGYVLSPVISHRDVGGDNSSSVKVSIEILDFQQPVTFTCDVSSPVELLIMQALCWAHDDLSQVDISSYVLKVCGQEEVLQNKHSLGSHEYVQNCRKWETEIQLQLLTHSTMKRDLARTEGDDASPIDLKTYLGDTDMPFKKTITRESLAEHLEEYHNQVNICLQKENTQYKAVDRIIQVVKNLCYLLDEVETPAITDAVRKLKRSVNLNKSCTSEGNGRSACSTNGYGSSVEEHLRTLTNALYDLVKLYMCSFCLDFPPQLDEERPEKQRDSQEASSVTEHVHFTLFAIHGISATWVSSFEKYYVMCSLMHNDENLLKPIKSKKVGTYKSFYYHIKWDELINFPIPVASVPLETVLSLTLYGVLNQNSSNSPESNKQHKGPELLGKVTMPLFDFRRVFARGSKLLSLWTFSLPGSAGKNKNLEERLILQIDLPSPQVDVLYVSPPEMTFPNLQSLEMPDPDIRKKIEKLCTPTSSSSSLTKGDMQLLWEHRYHCYKHEQSLPKILASTPSWAWNSVAEIHSLLHHWPPCSPVCALELLDSKFADTDVRAMAVSWIEVCSDDELTDYLPQLVQALKFENHLNNALVIFLLSRAQGNVNVAHQLYWLLRDAIQEPVFGQRYSHVLGALLCMCGSGLRAEFEKQACLVQLLGTLAEKVRQANSSSRQMVLQEGLEGVQVFFQKDTCRLPLSPSLVAEELNIKNCSFFNSNAVPLKLTLVNADQLGEEINVMFKVGEDMRQDMLALQMIRVMDRIWLQEGLDLRIVNFKCISTGQDKGMVELVPSSETLRKIQVEYGVTGSFKDKPLAEWLRKYNPAEDEYEKASENFIYSCAGCCVATYLLGICDRHNDNIMLRTTGHMFHIDFGKFLGHAQMIGTFKRDRAPFVLTSDMAYVINGGERPSSRFQLFVDLCSQAYNLIRKHSSLFLNLLSLMTQSGLPELTGAQDLKYVHGALQPQSTDAEATIFFTRLIESSLGSVATKFNFFIHNLAQLRFSGLPSNDEPILSFSPRTYTLKQDGRIRDASIFSFQKRYNPDKHYTYVVRILREFQSEPQFVFRTFDEFQELHNKLTIIFPLWKIPGFPNKVVLGRKHIKDVASKRKVELNIYVHSLMKCSAEVIQCDLIYTFFHPLARDDKTEGLDGLLKVPEEMPSSPVTGRVGGEVKLSVSYRNGTLFIMVMHIKDLVSDDGADPSPYVKMYLLPDPHKTSKRKTKVCRKTRNPTYNEMLVYSGYSKETLKQRQLQLNVLSAEYLRENCYLGGITLGLKDFDLSQETVKWYRLVAAPF